MKRAIGVLPRPRLNRRNASAFDGRRKSLTAVRSVGSGISESACGSLKLAQLATAVATLRLWTYGNVTGTCVDWLGYGGSASGNADLLCVDAANYMDSAGDSGAPILIWYLDDRAEIAGTHTAIRESERIFSPIEGIEADFGALGPVF